MTEGYEMNGNQTRSPSQLSAFVTWLGAALVVLICVWNGFHLVRIIPIFANLFQGLGVELPLPTRLLLATYRWLLPLNLAAMIAFDVAIQLSARQIHWKLVATGGMILLNMLLASAVQYALYAPLFVVINKLSDAK
jgi:type II secretory pathway component PulF